MDYLFGGLYFFIIIAILIFTLAILVLAGVFIKKIVYDIPKEARRQIKEQKNK